MEAMRPEGGGGWPFKRRGKAAAGGGDRRALSLGGAQNVPETEKSLELRE